MTTYSAKARSIRTTKTISSRGGAIARPDSFGYFLKVGLSGGIAGAVGSAALYPMDAAKTLRQSSPGDYKSVFQALGALAYSRTTAGKLTWHLQNVYRGIIPATLGAIPSSALYFGAYESMKTVLTRYFPQDERSTNNFSNRLLVHSLAAMSGNILSSAVFVPKELIKQQLQFRQSGNVVGVVMDILATKGLGGLYVGYKATLIRNIPTAVLRFSLYEEFRYRWYTQEQLQKGKKGKTQQQGVSPKFFLAGAAAGVLASGLMTPVDVLKTRLATGTCPLDVKSCFLWVVKQEGFVGLYSGAGSRMLFSGAFSAIGFGTFEWAKSVLGVSSSTAPPKSIRKSATRAVPSKVAVATSKEQQELERKDEQHRAHPRKHHSQVLFAARF
ncbi:adenosylmethionine carrier 1, chloroplastic/mitochondrial [Seminavis robusta]|uniref:Adenosylmethionine carrier 1, chloroplastic/mitochondrial n=1 Tax=Seminavis robusta TaxID=568900 RepID=A0A9N8E7Z6_9STRA|nr:adenosylmethionine carrier 1, chloroplastic/mitochondrial [Seminavis robusta]|eukprot:Sro644_g180500.1 adenosylmethionine carrier 1, chloroplastic/mitochondrial (385) ;mRNA; r:34995-36149